MSQGLTNVGQLVSNDTIPLQCRGLAIQMVEVPAMTGAKGVKCSLSLQLNDLKEIFDSTPSHSSVARYVG